MLLTVAMIIVVMMMMMTVMVMSINRLVGEGGEFPWLGRKQHCCARLDRPLL